MVRWELPILLLLIEHSVVKPNDLSKVAWRFSPSTA